MKRYAHQKETTNFLLKHPCTFITSTAGTGKTLSVLDAWHQARTGKMLVIAPKATLEAAWGNDCHHFYPRTKIGIFNRKETRKSDYLPSLLSLYDIVVINIEAVDLILQNKSIISDQYSTLVIDEFTSIKNRTSKRSKLVKQLSLYFKYRYLLSGTPTPNGTVDIWHPTLVLDGGTRLGNNYFKFRNSICQPVSTGYGGQFVEWKEYPGSTEVVASILKDITIQYELEDVIDMPERIYRNLQITMPKKLKTYYDIMVKDSLLMLSNTSISAANKAVVTNKLLQICSGTIYDDDGEQILLDSSKYELVINLIKERKHTLIFYIWNHQCQELENQLTKENITYAVIQGKNTVAQTQQIIKKYQAGEYQTLLLQPAAAAHGITLTKSEASIWCSPTWNLEYFIQANHRDYRIGQKKRTEVIMIQYKETLEKEVYDRLEHKKTILNNLLRILKT